MWSILEMYQRRQKKHGSQTSVLKHDGMNGSYIVADVVTSLDES